jgi:hypothetical protein
MVDILYERAAQLLEAELGDEIVGLDVDAGTCFGFNSVAASVWRLLDQPRSAPALKSALLEEYEVAEDLCSRELDGLLDDLVARRLIKRIDADPAAPAAIA